MPAPLISVSEARALVLDRVTPPAPESVAVAWAQDRVLAAAVIAAADTPPFPSSAMDGYAARRRAGGPAPDRGGRVARRNAG